MPSKDEHIRKAQGNELFARSIAAKDQTRIDWKLVVFFYAAVHYVEAYLAATMGSHLRSHTTRDSYVGRTKELRTIFSQYSHLKYLGYNARYEVLNFTEKDTVAAEKDFDTVKNHISAMLYDVLPGN